MNIALGTMHFGTRVDEQTSYNILDKYVELGGRWIDTANCYAFWGSAGGFGGQSETTIGRWLASRPDAREHVLLSTKVGAEPKRPGGFPTDVEGLSRRAVLDAVAGSLERLGVDSVDLLWTHMEDRSTELHETVDVLGDLVDGGRAARIGWSNHPVWRVERARCLAGDRGNSVVAAIQQRWSYLHPRPDAPVEGQDHPFGMMSTETLDYASSNPGIELWGYTPLMTGFYHRPGSQLPSSYDHPGTHRRLRALQEVADETGATLGQIVLAWMNSSRPAVRPIVGVSSVEQLESAAAAAELRLSQAHMEKLDTAS